MDYFNKKEVIQKLENNQPVNLSFQFIDEQFLLLLNSILVKALSKMDHIFLLSSVVTILREVIVNALKANAKRVFFAKQGYDINNSADYQKGMTRFKKEIIGEFDLIKEDVVESNFFINLDIEWHGADLKIIVSNNVAIHPQELERVRFRIEKAKKCNDFTDAYDDIEDDSEGAGLGIVLTILFLKNMGIDPGAFQITSDGKLTITSLLIPEQLRPPSITTTVKKQIVEEIEGIPTFPENIIQLQRMCNDPESSIDKIAERIKMDPALATDVIKLSNSAGFSPGKRIENINMAIMTIGLKNLDAILLASNARRILNERYTKYEQIWEHCNKVAFYSRNIALSFKMTQLVEHTFMGGLLHDLGKIILLATDLRLVKKIANIVKDRKMVTSTIMEEIAIGISHSSIGELIANKWNFPEYLVESVRYHHAPLSCSEQHQDTVFIVYLANIFAGIEERKYNFYYVEETVLERFGLSDEAKFTALHEKLKAKYEMIS